MEEELYGSNDEDDDETRKKTMRLRWIQMMSILQEQERLQMGDESKKRRVKGRSKTWTET